MEQALWDRLAEAEEEVHEDTVSAEAFEAVCSERLSDISHYMDQRDEALLDLNRTRLELENLQKKHVVTEASYRELYEKARAYLDAAEREGEIDESRDLRDLLCDESDIEKQIESEGYDGS